MKLPAATPEFSRAYSIARALVFPGTIREDLVIIPHQNNLLDVVTAQLAMQALTWTEKEIEDKLLDARAAFLAERKSEIAKIRKELATPKVKPTAVPPELQGKIGITI